MRVPTRPAERSHVPVGILAALVLPASLLLAARAEAQREGTTYLSYVGSEVSLVSSGEDDTVARLNTPVLAGDRISTGTGSRAEAILAEGGVLRLDARTNVRFDRLARTWESDDERTILVLERGALSLETRWTSSRDLSPRIDTEDASVVLPDRGLVRVDSGRRGTEVYVVRGRAEVTTRSGRAWVGPGEYAWASGEEPLEVTDGGLPRDQFTRFIEERRELPASSAGSRYVPADYAYDVDSAQLDSYGTWVWVSDYNTYCWRPTVGSDWAPYTSGYWRWTPGGMTWVSYESWGWMPYHYGSWCYDAVFGWCWMPGSYYSPAWVYWSYSPGWVGWCPMGYYGGYSGWYVGGGSSGGGGGVGVGVHGRSVYGGPGSAGPRWGGRYPHLQGRVDLARIDRRGWSFVSSGTIGGRFDRSSVVRGERLDLRPSGGAGSLGIVASSPLRVDRGPGRSVASSVQDAVRRISASGGVSGDSRAGSRDVDEGLTSILRRDAGLSPSARQKLDASWTRPGRDTYRPLTAEALASAPGSTTGPGQGRRADGAPPAGREASAAGSASSPPSLRGGGDAGRPGGGLVRGIDRLSGGPGERPRGDGWRETAPPAAAGSIGPAGSGAGASAGAPGPRRGEGSAARPPEGSPSGGARSGVRPDDGWRRGAGTVSQGTAPPASPASPPPPASPRPPEAPPSRGAEPPRASEPVRPAPSDAWRSGGGRSSQGDAWERPGSTGRASASPSVGPSYSYASPRPSSPAPGLSRSSSPGPAASAPSYSAPSRPAPSTSAPSYSAPSVSAPSRPSPPPPSGGASAPSSSSSAPPSGGGRRQ